MTELERERDEETTMFSYAQTPAMERRNLEDRLARASTRSRHETSPDAGSRTKARSPDRSPEAEGERAARRILNADGAREVEVDPEAERAARFILEAEAPDEDVEEAVDMIKRAGRKRDAREDEE